MNWTGPRGSDLLNEDGCILLRPVPPERWPYGPPSWHQSCCVLHSGGLYCDCEASDSSDLEHGAGGWPTKIPDDDAVG